MSHPLGVPGVRLFIGDKPPKTIFHSYLGKMEIGEEGIFFYSSGGHGLRARILGAILLNPHLIFAQYFEERGTKNLKDLSREGSLMIPFGEITEASPVRKIGMKYLLVLTKDGRMVWFWRDLGPFPLDEIIAILKAAGVKVADEVE